MGLLGNLVTYAGTVTSVATIVIGLIYLYNKPPSFPLKWDCPWKNPDEYTYWVDCNQQWSTSWGMVGLPKWCALLVGIGGTAMVSPGALEVVGFPKNCIQYACFLVFQAFFANFGFCGKIGVAVGYVSCAVALVALAAGAMDEKSDRMEYLEEQAELGYEKEEFEMKSDATYTEEDDDSE
eukprot:TRINITY_DN6850_c0_g2_i1.p1 TRINITY_DN6850_c0_g2~~TRINITY_DN6850_c0_g2_i1.p1  ORF type:complete len:180 (+),score=43.52 TRINITY_DN6850_c0_g2_i1:45-584(+)